MKRWEEKKEEEKKKKKRGEEKEMREKKVGLGFLRWSEKRETGLIKRKKERGIQRRGIEREREYN